MMYSFINSLPTVVEISIRMGRLREVEIELLKAEGEVKRLTTLRREIKDALHNDRRSLRGLSKEEYDNLRDNIGQETFDEITGLDKHHAGIYPVD